MQNTLEHCFLVSMPSIHGDVFDKSVVYIHEHSSSGSMGLIINKPMQVSLRSILEHLDIPCDSPVPETPVLMGGPVDQNQGFILHADNDAMSLSGSKETLTEIANGTGPLHYIIALGCAGWQPGQLEAEIKNNAWLIAPFDETLLFETPIEERWQAAAGLMGIDINQISTNIGHA